MDNLQEAYLSVYEATAMAKRGLDEPAIRKQIASNTKGGEAADRATALENQPTYGDKNKQAQRSGYARAQRGNFRKTASSNPGLHGYAHKATNPADQAKQDARGAQRGVLTNRERQQLNREEVDLFDYLLEYLVAEGYADTNDNAIAIMANMSEEWRNELLEKADNVIMTVKSPSGEERSKIRKGATVPSDWHRHETSSQISGRRFSQKLSDREKQRNQRMAAGRLTVATKRGIEKATNRSADNPTRRNQFAPGSATREIERDDLPTDYRARKRRASGR